MTATGTETAPDAAPAALRKRIRSAIGVGAWLGGLLGLLGFLVATLIWVAGATASGEDASAPVILADPTSVILGAALISIFFGAIVSSLSRYAVDKTRPSMRLRGSAGATARFGAVLGLFLGTIGGAALTGIFTAEMPGGMIELPILTTLGVTVLGGALLGAATAAITQAIGVPVEVNEGEEEIAAVRRRLTAALSVPLTGLVILALLVIPFAWLLLESSHLAKYGAAILGIVAAVGILAFAALGGSFPHMRISLGEGVVAWIGISAVIVAILAVLVVREPSPASSGAGGTVAIVAQSDITFDQTAWTSEEGGITLIYTDEGDLRHTLLVEGHESDLELEVKADGQTDEGVINLLPGTYTIYCGIKGHREAGMEGILTVTAAPEES